MREAVVIILSVVLMAEILLLYLLISRRLEARLTCLQQKRSEAVEQERQYRDMILHCESSLQEIKNRLT